jgi:hypothetical protein
VCYWDGSLWRHLFLGAGLVNRAMTTALGTGQTYHQLDVSDGI